MKPPVQVFGIEGRYACALYSAASKQKSLEAVERDLTSLQADMKKDANLRELIVNPSIKRSLKATALKEASAKVRYNAATGFFLEQLAENGRLNKIDSIINAYKLIMAAHRGEVVCEVITAKPLEASQRKELEAQLKVSSCYFLKLLLNFSHFPEICQIKRNDSTLSQGRCLNYRRNGRVDWRQIR